MVVIEDEVMVIELNPFATTTGPSLFHWGHDEDILKNGSGHFRLREKNMENLDDFVDNVILPEMLKEESHSYLELLDHFAQELSRVPSRKTTKRTKDNQWSCFIL